MNTTERLYLENPYLTKLYATVTNKRLSEGHCIVELDQTIFYPHLSGGQPRDLGTINDIEVINVIEENGKILHFLNEDLPSGKVTLMVDWDTRFSHMQSHTAQHILSYACKKLFNLETVGFKISESYTTVDLATDFLSEKEIHLAEILTNSIIQTNLPIKCYAGDLLKFPEKKEIENTLGILRIVEIEEIDSMPCAGTHVKSTGEVGCVKILYTEKVNGKLRLYFLCGQAVLKDYHKKTLATQHINQQLSANTDTLIEKFDDFWAKYESLSLQNQKLKDDNLKYQSHFLLEHATPIGSYGYVSQLFYDSDVASLKRISEVITAKDNYIAVLGLISENKCHLIISCHPSVPLDCKELLNKVLPLLDGKGGGTKSFVQAGGNNVSAVEKIIQALNQFIVTQLDQ